MAALQIAQLDLSAQCLYDFLADGETKARAAAGITCGKGLEQTLSEFIINAAAAVFYAQQSLITLRAYIDLKMPALRRVANGVVQQVAGQLSQHPLMCRNVAGSGFDAKVHVMVGNQGGKLQSDVAHDLI